MAITMPLMPNFKITYVSGGTETIEARSFHDVGEHGRWIDFVDGGNLQLLRVQAGEVRRIEFERPT